MTARFRAALWLACVVLAWGWAASAASSPFRAFAPGHESEILVLFEPFAPDQKVGEVTFAGVQVGSNSIAAHAVGPNGAAAQLVLTARDADRPAQPLPGALVPSASFDLTMAPPTAEAKLAGLLGALAERVRLHDPGGLVEQFTAPVQAPGSAPQAPASRTAAVVWLAAAAMLWLCALAAVAVLAASALRHGPTDLGRRVGVLAVVGVAAWLFRWHAPETLLHCNNHGLEDLRAVLGPGLVETPRLILRYGPSFFGPQAWLAAALGGGDAAVFALSALVGTAATLLATVAAWVWTPGLGSGLVAGLAMAVLPLAVRVGHGESNLVFGQASIALMVLAAGVRVRHTAPATPPPPGHVRWATAALLAAATLLTATGHTFGPGYAVAVLALVAEALPGHRRGVRAWATAAAWFLLPVAAFALLLGSSDGSNRARLAAATLGEASPLKPLAHLLWSEAEWTPWAAQGLFGVGAVRFMAAGSRVRRASTLPALALLAGLALFIGGSASVALRYQALLAPVWAVVAGAAWTAMPQRRSVAAEDAEPGPIPWQRWKALAVAALAVFAFLGAALAGPAHRYTDLEAQVYAALRPVVPTLPDGAVVVVPDRQGSPDQEIIIDFPDFLAKHAGRHVTVLHLGEWRRMQREAVTARPSAVFVWRSPHCQARARVVGRWPEGKDAEGLPLRDVCRPLVDLAWTPGARVVVQGRHPAPRDDPSRLPDEYHQFAGRVVVWSLVQLPHGTGTGVDR
ncbi:MAG: hypothetical protein FJ100_14205 [Deltaproteobacteria bacterium]|nr:hypothetical protein [Deltaproteobacteria bacterium]